MNCSASRQCGMTMRLTSVRCFDEVTFDNLDNRINSDVCTVECLHALTAFQKLKLGYKLLGRMAQVIKPSQLQVITVGSQVIPDLCTQHPTKRLSSCYRMLDDWRDELNTVNHCVIHKCNRPGGVRCQGLYDHYRRCVGFIMTNKSAENSAQLCSQSSCRSSFVLFDRLCMGVSNCTCVAQCSRGFWHFAELWTTRCKNPPPVEELEKSSGYRDVNSNELEEVSQGDKSQLSWSHLQVSAFDHFYDSESLRLCPLFFSYYVPPARSIDESHMPTSSNYPTPNGYLSRWLVIAVLLNGSLRLI